MTEVRKQKNIRLMPKYLKTFMKSFCNDFVQVFRTFPVTAAFEPGQEKTNFLVSDLVRHKLGCTATEYGLMLEISDLER